LHVCKVLFKLFFILKTMATTAVFCGENINDDIPAHLCSTV
jgi:hypothetical protein